MEVRSATMSEVQEAQAAGRIAPLVRLALDMNSCVTAEEMHANFYATLDRGFTPINDYLGKYSGTCSLVGSGPSIKESYKEIVGDVFSINSSLWFLLDKGIVPKFHMIWDGWEICEKFAVPHPDITYLIASRCHPAVFKKLEGCKVIVWHAAGDHDIYDVMQKEEVQKKLNPSIQPLINGGSAGITRGMYVASALGYSDLHIFGGDSSYSDDGETHIMGSVVKEKDMVVSLGDGSDGAPATWFRTTPEWCQQVNEYRVLYTVFTSNPENSMTCHGKGLMQEMHRRLEAKRKLQGQEKFFQEMIAEEEKQQAANALASGLVPPQKPQTLEVTQ